MVNTMVAHKDAVQVFEQSQTITNWQAVGGTQHDAIDILIGLTYQNSGTVFGARDGIYFGGATVQVYDPNTMQVNPVAKPYAGGAAKIVNSGSIFGGVGDGGAVPAGAGVEFAAAVTSASVTNLSGGAIYGPVGIYSESLSTKIVNSGSVSGDIAIELQNGAGGSIVNSGLIHGDATGVLVSSSAAFTISNSGTIEGADRAVTLETGGSKLVNTGTLFSEALAIKSIAIVAVENRGTIEGDVEMRGSLKNSGHISGDVTFGSGADLYDGRLGHVEGTVSGGTGTDTIYGGTEANVIDGGTEADTMEGGDGSDIYYVDIGGDKVAEEAGTAGGVDTVRVSVSYTLSAEVAVEKLEASNPTGTTAFNLFGNEFAQTITGNDGANSLVGNEGNDVISARGGADGLQGGLGNDTLAGNGGNDNFYFNSDLDAATNVDRILDFSQAVDNSDLMRLDKTIFTELGAAAGFLNSDFFMANATGTATDGNDHIIFETDTGKLFYDSNGNLAGGATQFATITNFASLTGANAISAGDFYVY